MSRDRKSKSLSSGKYGETLAQGITRRRFLKLGAGASGVAMLGLSGCGVFQSDGGGEEDGESGGNTLNLNLGADIPDLNTATMTDTISFDVNNNLLEGLYRLDDDVQPVPAQAEGVEISDDQTTYTFTLRDGIQWSNGDAVTSQNFKDAWLRVLNPETAAIFAFVLTDYIKGAAEYNAGDADASEVGIETPDDKTLVVRLLRPVSYFLGFMAFGTYLPVNQGFLEEQGDDYAQGADSILYNGPYTMTRFDPQNGATLKKNPDYWDSENIAIENVNLRVVKDGSTALNLYESGELDRVRLDSEQVSRFEDSPEFETYTTGSITWLNFNHEDEVMANTNVRQALVKAVDSEALARQVLNNGSKPAAGLVPAGMAGPGDQTFREAFGDVAQAFDPDEAKRLWETGIEELGGQAPTLSLLAGDTSSEQDVATFMQSQIQENLGAQIEVNIQPLESLLERMGDGDYQIAWYGWIPAYNDPSGVLDSFLSDISLNYSNYANERYDELVKSARTETDDQARMEAFAEAEDLLLNEDAAVGPKIFSGGAQLVKPYLEASPPLPFKTLDLKSFRLEGK